jgi:hypothetical protein
MVVPWLCCLLCIGVQGGSGIYQKLPLFLTGLPEHATTPRFQIHMTGLDTNGLHSQSMYGCF